MQFFNINKLIKGFNQLQQQVEAYLEAQRVEVERLEKLVADAKSDQAKGEGIAKALKAISSGE